MLSSLVSEWTFDELTSDGKTKDTWGSNHGTVVGAEWVDDCVYGKCYKFNGTSDYIDCGNNESLDITGAITMSAWIKANDKTNLQTLFGKGTSFDGGVNKGYSLGIYNTKIYFDTYDSVQRSDLQSSSGTVKQNEWFFLTATWDGTTTTNGKKIYINGVLNRERTSTISEITGTSIFNFSITKSPFFNGLIDDVRIYNSALSSAQIKQNYIAGLDSMLRNGGLSKDEYSQRLQALANTDFAF